MGQNEFLRFTWTGQSPMLPSMLLIATALAEELETMLSLCSSKRKTRIDGVPVWTGTRGNRTFSALKLGVGPVRSAAALERALPALKARGVLVTGYAGALDPALKVGELIVVDHARLMIDAPRGAALGDAQLGPEWPLAGTEDLFGAARTSGLAVRRGTVITSPCVIGAPEQKRILFQKFHATILDMETAALARVASSFGVTLSCVRAVTDVAEDDFLAAFVYDPHAGSMRRAARFIAAGHFLDRYGQWRERSNAARHALRRFFGCYMDRTDF